MKKTVSYKRVLTVHVPDGETSDFVNYKTASIVPVYLTRVFFSSQDYL